MTFYCLHVHLQSILDFCHGESLHNLLTRAESSPAPRPTEKCVRRPRPRARAVGAQVKGCWVSLGSKRLLGDNVTSLRRSRFLLRVFCRSDARKGRFILGAQRCIGRVDLNGLFMVSKRNTSGAVFHVRWKWAWHPDRGAGCSLGMPRGCQTSPAPA